MRSPEEHAEVLRLVADGWNDSAIARATGISRWTVRSWRKGGRRPGWTGTSCKRCGHPIHQPDRVGAAYAYLLGPYLGDGYIASHPRKVFRLSIVLDVRYPGIIDACAEAMKTVLGGKEPGRTQREGCVAVNSYSKQWPCLFPQHGPGMKHTRPIVLADWQEAIVAEHPEPLLRGLIHSDGWRGTNRVTVRGKRYEYPRYNFDNASDDIRAIFCGTCDAIGVQWRQMSARTISVARRRSVARLDEFVGPKR